MKALQRQYEQRCNALSASKLGVPVIHSIDDDFVPQLNQWIQHDKAIDVNFPDETAQIIDNMIKQYAKPAKS